MDRNLDRRVEALRAGHRPGEPGAARRARSTLAFRDDIDCWEQQPDGSWRRTTGGEDGLADYQQAMATRPTSVAGSERT